MSRTSRVLAGVAGFVVAFVFVMIVTALSPQGQPESGTVELQWRDFAFVRDAVEATEGSTLSLVNEGPVPVTFEVHAPGGENASVRVGPGARDNVTLERQGTYVVRAAPYGWSQAEVEVRTANPFMRFIQDVF